jgi:hypothetical protein
MTVAPRRLNRCRPNTPEEAKARFVVMASRVGPGRAIQMAPWKAVGLALTVGMLLGYSRPLRRGLVRVGKLSLKSLIAVVTHLCPGPLPALTLEEDAHLSSKRRNP